MKGFVLTILSWDANGSWIRSHTEPPLVLFLQPKSARNDLILLGRLGHWFYAQFNGNYGNWIMQSMLTLKLFPPLQKLSVHISLFSYIIVLIVIIDKYWRGSQICSPDWLLKYESTSQWEGSNGLNLQRPLINVFWDEIAHIFIFSTQISN